MIYYLSNINNHFFVTDGVKLNLNSSDLDGVIFYESQEDMYKALAKEEGLNDRDVIGKEFLLFERNGDLYLKFLGKDKQIDIFECQFYKDGILESCFSVEDFLSLFSL